MLGLPGGGEGAALRRELPEFARAFRGKGVFAQTTFIEEASAGEGLVAAMQALEGTFFRPNCVFLRLPPGRDPAREEELHRVIRRARVSRTGVLLYADHPEARLGRRRTINVWVRDQSPDWELSMRLGNLDMSLLVGHILQEAWTAELNVICVVDDPEQAGPARSFFELVTDLARLPKARVRVVVGNLDEQLERLPTADLDIFGLGEDLDFESARRLLRMTHSSCLFVRDSEEENVLA